MNKKENNKSAKSVKIPVPLAVASFTAGFIGATYLMKKADEAIKRRTLDDTSIDSGYIFDGQMNDAKEPSKEWRKKKTPVTDDEAYDDAPEYGSSFDDMFGGGME